MRLIWGVGGIVHKLCHPVTINAYNLLGVCDDTLCDTAQAINNTANSILQSNISRPRLNNDIRIWLRPNFGRWSIQTHARWMWPTAINSNCNHRKIPLQPWVYSSPCNKIRLRFKTNLLKQKVGGSNTNWYTFRSTDMWLIWLILSFYNTGSHHPTREN